jgi:apolipoprotein N-acyltransferase
MKAAGTSRPRGPWQTISRGAAWSSYACALACVVALIWWLGDLGAHHPVIASLAAAVVFFVSAGLVLHVMGLANLPNLRFDRKDEPPPGV